MSGRKQFNEGRALDSAMALFWEKGFAATSLGDLESATGLNKSSIYNAYRSKEGLFVRCLERFGARYGTPLVTALEARDFRAALEGFFAALIARMADVTIPSGCMATFAAQELGPAGGAPAETVREALERVREAFVDRCRRAEAEGQLRPGTDPESAAAACLAMTRGVAVLNRGYGDVTVARQAARHLIDGLVA